ncbi:unnamed protein product, partial [Ilex paraguariensis]
TSRLTNTRNVEEWESKNHQIISSFRNTSTPSMSHQFGRFNTLIDIFELVQAFLLHRNPLPTLEQAISELLSKATHFGTVRSSHPNIVLATHRPRGNQLSQPH